MQVVWVQQAIHYFKPLLKPVSRIIYHGVELIISSITVTITINVTIAIAIA